MNRSWFLHVTGWILSPWFSCLLFLININIWQAMIYSKIQLFLWLKDKTPYCLRSAVKNCGKCCKLLIAVGHEKYPVHWSLMFACDWVENLLCYLQPSFLHNAIVRQPWSSSVADTQKSPWPRNEHMGNDPEKQSIHVLRETAIRRENFLSCQPSKIIGSATRVEWSTSEQTTGLLQAL